MYILCLLELGSVDFLFYFILIPCRLKVTDVYLFILAATVICIHQNWLSDEPLTLLANIVVIPVSFTINFAIDRRENLLLNIAGFKVRFF